MLYDDRHVLTGLRRQWALVTLLYGGVLATGYWTMLQFWPAPAALRWLTLASATMAVQMVVLWWALRFNHPPTGAALFTDLGIANSMTLTRGLLTCLMAGFLFGPAPQGWLAWAPAVLYMTERVIDFFDGFVARYTRRETKLGSILDMEFDGLGILIAVGIAIQLDHLPLWYLILGLGRQLFIFGIWVRQRLGWPVFDLPPSDHRRLIAGFQTGFISIILWPTWTTEVAMAAAWLFAVPLLFSFGRDWLVVSATLDAASPGYQRVRQRAKLIFEQWLPPLVRLLGAALVGWMIVQGASLTGGLAWLAALAAVLLLLGALGRAAALVLAFVAAFSAVQIGLRLDNALLLLCAVYILHLGSGRLAAWTPEEYYLHTKLGARDEVSL
ncbi:MAG TPA: CDP-alcohol phosphatidyltransferase family protein [Chloroflexi bacterium]|nr:CDP-alcohol phosphatidyltransferase family protein [Chloroflexota bacterium]